MKFKEISTNCYYFSGAVNIGYVHKGHQGLLIDAGLDAAAMKKVLKHLDTQNLPITHLFITHAHADHYGGAGYLQQIREVYTIAPKFEEAILKYPILEPMYLFQGNHPLEELRNKFLEGEAITIDRVVGEEQVDLGEIKFHTYHFPGHSEYQLGILIDQVLYASDAYFSVETLKKHKIPFLVDAEAAIKSLKKLMKIECNGAVPGHGEFEKDFYDTVRKNITYHEMISKSLTELINRSKSGISQEELTKIVCDKWDVNLNHLSSYMLYRTAITAYIIKLIKDKKVTYTVKNNRLLFLENGEAD